MLIKRVVIQGFKTFATRTEFLFDAGVTALVGPNGSGKSNIVDAVRWCLGEQSFSLLRSKKTSDIIFAGSDKKARLGLAEVSLTLDNSAGELPLDYAEVEITRRAYRDGENEYLINGQRVRLQDISETLAQTGLGKRTYSLIGQGLIDRVLSLAPEERRSLFEEAAGITGHQMKRTGVLRRLEATQQNLTRAQDILAELGPRLKQLRRQAERANERTQIAEDLRGLLRLWYGYRWHAALRQHDDQLAEEQRRQAAVAERQAGLARLSARIEEERRRQAALRGAAGRLHAEAGAHHRTAEETNRELAVAQERSRQLAARSEEARRELAPLRFQQQTLEARLDESRRNLAAAEQELAQRAAAVQTIQSELAQRQTARAALDAALEEARRRLDQTSRSQAENSARLRQLAERRAETAAQEEAHTASLAAAQGAAAEAAAALAASEAAAAAADEHAQAAEAELRALEQRSQEQRSRLAAAEAARRDADRAVDRLQTRLDMLRRLQSEGAGYGGGVRSVLQAARSPQPALPGILGTVAALIQAPPHLDKALETALGGALQNVVVRTWDDAGRAIDHLKRTGGGRATFLPLDRLYVQPALPAPRAAGLIGNAADLVEYDPQIREVVQQLLGRVWVVEELEAARRALDGWRQSSRPTVVTLDGEIVRPGGAVTGGAERSRQDDSLLARARELRELPPQVENAAAQARQAAAACAELNRAIESAQVEIAARQRAQAELARAERRGRQQVEELRRQADRAAQTVRWQEERRAQAAAELARLAEQEAALAAGRAGIQQSRAQAEAALAHAQAELDAAGVGTLLQELADVRAAAAEAQGALRSQQALQENQRRSHQSVTDQIAAKERRIAELRGDEELLAARLQELGGQESELGRTLEALQRRIDPLERELAQIEQDQSAREADERSAQALLRKEEAAWNNAQLQRQRAEDLIGQLRFEMEQDLGLVALEESERIAYQPPLPLEAWVEQLPVILEIPDELAGEVKEMRAGLSRVSNVNPDAPREYAEAAERHAYLDTQARDLEAAAADLRKVLKELDERMEAEFQRTFQAVSTQFEHYFTVLFNGGSAKLALTEPEDLSRTGVEIIARPPGKRPQSLALLSGGERTLAACALIFAILHVSPTPFCVLDEVDAALDESNVDRVRLTLAELSRTTQFIVVTHNRRTLEGANAIYGVTMGADGVSKVISLQLEGDKIVQRGAAQGEAAADRSQIAEIEELVKL